MPFQPWVPTAGSAPTPLPVAQGGTGAATAAAGLANLGSLVQQATTGTAGFALQNATPTVISWTAPADGNMHRVRCVAMLRVTVAETGGSVQLSLNAPDGTATTRNISAGGAGTGITYNDFEVFIQSGSTVSIAQNSALTVGAAVLWADLWGL